VSALLLSIAGAGLVFVRPENRGVVISAISPQGYRQAALEPGLHWIVPFFESVVTYPISQQTYTMSIAPSEGQIIGDDSITARTADGQEIFVDASVIFSLDPQDVVRVHIAWQDRYSSDLVRPLARGVIRDVVSQYRVEQVVSTKRDEMVTKISDGMRQQLEKNGLLMSNFILRNITFSPEYAASVEQKQIAEQLAQQAKLIVEQRKQEAEQARQAAQGVADSAVIRAKGDAEARIIQAEAEAQALDLLAQALQDKPDLLTYQYITKLSPNIQAMLLPSNQPFLFPLPTVNAPLPLGQSSVLPTPAPTTTP
jgi:regulator of protease activity HflC (stomatin/prohibitin superfamily)